MTLVNTRSSIRGEVAIATCRDSDAIGVRFLDLSEYCVSRAYNLSRVVSYETIYVMMPIKKRGLDRV